MALHVLGSACAVVRVHTATVAVQRERECEDGTVGPLQTTGVPEGNFRGSGGRARLKTDQSGRRFIRALQDGFLLHVYQNNGSDQKRTMV